MSRVIAGAAAIALLLAPLASAGAQDWPTRAVTMVVPYAAGGPVDTLGRILAARLSDILGQQVVVENVAGAGGMTGSSRVAKAPPDGYTVLLSGSAVLAINQPLYKRPLYNAVTDFEHVALFSDSARVLITRKDLPVTTLAEFVAYAKANQAKMQYGSAGAGSGMHVCAVLLDAAMSTKITHVPYRGSAPAMQDLMGGRIDFVAKQISTALPQIQGGTVKAIATLGLEALSRGAAFALFIDDGAEARALLRENVAALGLGGVTRIFRRDACKLGMAHPVEPFSLVFLDPPYGRGLAEAALSSAHAGGWLTPDALIMVEEAASAEFAAPAGFDELERRRYDDTALVLLRHRG